MTRIYCARGGASDRQKLLDRLAITQPIGDRGDIIHAVDVGIEHRVGAVLGDLLHAAMQVADDALGSQNLLAIQLQDDAQHAVGRWVLGAHVEDHFGGIEEGVLLGIEVEEIGSVKAAAAHCPLSMPRLICTHSLSCNRMS